MVALQIAPNRSQWSAVDHRLRRERACVSWLTPLDRRQRLIADAVHHGFKVIAHLPREAYALDDSCRAEQRQHANIVQRQCPVHRSRAFDQPIELFKLEHQRLNILARLCAQLDEIAQPLSFPHDIVIARGNRVELWKTEKWISGPCQRRGLIGGVAGPLCEFTSLRAYENRCTEVVDVRDHIHALEHRLTVVLDENGNTTFADKTDHCLGVVFENDSLLKMQTLERRRHAHAETDGAVLP